MGQITRTTNPTRLRQIDKKLFVVRVRNESSDGRVFWLDSFDYEAANLDPSVLLGCIVHAGSTEEYFELGPLSDFKKTPTSIRDIATDKPLKFRFIFNRPGESLLIGYTDSVRALDEAGNLGSSLVDIEPTDLHGIAWKLILPEGKGSGDKPNVLVERSLFPTATSAVNQPWFGTLVMPEVMRQVAIAIAKDPSALEDPETWIAAWSDFITTLGANLPIEFDEEDILAQEAWADDVVRRFATKGMFKHHMAEALAEMEGEQS